MQVKMVPMNWSVTLRTSPLNAGISEPQEKKGFQQFSQESHTEACMMVYLSWKQENKT